MKGLGKYGDSGFPIPLLDGSVVRPAQNSQATLATQTQNTHVTEYQLTVRLSFSVFLINNFIE